MTNQEILDNCIKATNDSIAVGNNLSSALGTANSSISEVNKTIQDGKTANSQTVSATNTCKTETAKCTTATTSAQATEQRMIALLNKLKNGIDGGDSTNNKTII